MTTMRDSRVLFLLLSVTILPQIAFPQSTNSIPLFDAVPLTDSGLSETISNKFFYKTKTVTVSCASSPWDYAWVRSDTDSPWPGIKMDGYITVGNDMNNICYMGIYPESLGLSPMMSLCNNGFMDPSVYGWLPAVVGSDPEYVYAPALARFFLAAGKNELIFKLWDFGGLYGNSKLVLTLPEGCSSVPEPVVVGVDLKPGDYPNRVNLCSNGIVTVAILGSPAFDVRTINADTLKIGSASPRMVGKSNKSSCVYKDVSGNFASALGLMGAPDGNLDLVCQFSTVDMSNDATTTSIEVTGQLANGSSFKGTDTISIVKDGCVQ